jgi:ComF family protein
MPSLLDLFVPSACCGCGRLGGGILCSTCIGSLQPASNPPDRFLVADPSVVIGEAVVLAVAALSHEGSVRKALERLKYAGARHVAEPIAHAAEPALRRLLAISGPATLVPVPLHLTRLGQRGYNQALLLADALGRGTGLPVRELIVRTRETTKQHRLDRAARLRNLQDAFAPAPRRPHGGTVVLVDDILTTSATLEACAGVLRRQGIDEVYGFAVAREI